VRQSDPIAEGARIMAVCNACRYCQGYCPVFPAMERRLEFAEADLNYLANLCHNCAECYYACQYAPPHEFAVNVPQVLAQIRVRSYQQYAWPRLFGKEARLAAAVLVLALLAGLLFAPAGADFYAVVPHRFMVLIFGAVGVWASFALLASVLRFTEPRPKGAVAALRAILSQKHMSRGPRRWFHHATFYGFLLCFASTTVAALYHYALGLRAPYAYLSVPVILGTLGGIGLLIGPVGLYFLKRRRDPETVDTSQDPMDLTFLALLFATSLSGLLLLALRETTAMRPLLLIHLAIVLALFVTLPYGKFVHGIYRAAALLRFAVEEGSSRQTHGAGQG